VRLRFALATLALAGAVHATPAERFGFGAREAALSSAVAADTSDHAAVYYDPAALTLGTGPSVGFGYQIGHYALKLDDRPYSPDTVHVIEGGFVARGRLLGKPVAFGLAFALPGANLSSLQTLRADRPAWLLDELSNHVAFAGAGAAFRPWPWLSVGATLGYLAAVRGGFTVSGSAAQPVGEQTVYDSQLRHAVDAELVSVRYPTFGLLLEPNTTFRLAAVYREAATIEQQIEGELSGDVDYGALRVPVTYHFGSQSVGAHLPRQLTLAVSLLAGPHTRWDASLTWQDLSAMPSPEARTSTRVSADAPAGLIFELPPDRDAPAAHGAGFRDRLVPRLGVEHGLELSPAWELALRGGVAYEPSAREGTSVWLDASRLSASAGAGVESGALRLDAYFAYAHFVQQNVRVIEGFPERSIAGSALSSGSSLRVSFH
jgi:hypothetical protein